MKATNGRALAEQRPRACRLHQQRRRGSDISAVGRCQRKRGSEWVGVSIGVGRGATDCTVAVSWNNYQQPRWAKNDQPNIKKTVEDGGGKYIDADANLSNEQQLTDINNLIGQGAKVLILLGQDTKAVLPGVQAAKDAGVKVIAYDRLIEDPDIFYITFDNVAVGKAEADAVLKKVPEGNYVLIKGDPGDPNASTFLPQGWDDAGLKAAVDAKKTSKCAANGRRTPVHTPTPGRPTRPKTTWKRSSTRRSLTATRSTRSWPRTTARRLVSPAP